MATVIAELRVDISDARTIIEGAMRISSELHYPQNERMRRDIAQLLEAGNAVSLQSGSCGAFMAVASEELMAVIAKYRPVI